MEIINDIEWFFYGDEIKNAVLRETGKKVTKKQLGTVVFNETTKFSLPLDDELSLMETIELSGPITVEHILKMVKEFYRQPLTPDKIKDDDWLDDMGGDIDELTNYHLLDDTCTPDFCGLEENEGEYIVCIGPI